MVAMRTGIENPFLWREFISARRPVRRFCPQNLLETAAGGTHPWHMPEAVIVSTRRTPIGRAFKGSLKDMRPDDLAGFIAGRLVDDLDGFDPIEIEDVICG